MGRSRLWLRSLDQTEARPLAGTEGATYPFWSPDSRSIGFFASNKLLRFDVAGGAPQMLATLTGNGLGGSWSADGTILFPRQTTGALWRVPAAGGEPVAVTRLDPPRQIGHLYPHFLPDGRRFLFYATGTPEAAGIYLGSLDGGTPTRLTAADSPGAFLPPDYVIFVESGALVARRLDLAGASLQRRSRHAGRSPRRGPVCPLGCRRVTRGHSRLSRQQWRIATAHVGRPDGSGRGRAWRTRRE